MCQDAISPQVAYSWVSAQLSPLQEALGDFSPPGFTQKLPVHHQLPESAQTHLH